MNKRRTSHRHTQCAHIHARPYIAHAYNTFPKLKRKRPFEKCNFVESENALSSLPSLSFFRHHKFIKFYINYYSPTPNFPVIRRVARSPKMVSRKQMKLAENPCAKALN